VFTFAAVLGYLVLMTVIRRLQRTSSVTQLGWDDAVVTAVRAPLQLGYWLAVLMVAWQWLVVVQFDIVTDWADWIPQTAFLFVGAWTLHRLIIGFEAELIRSKGAALDSTAIASIHAVAKLTRVILWVLVILTALQGVGVSVSGLLAFGGIGGIAVGLRRKICCLTFWWHEYLPRSAFCCW
jgi:Mechanosensitive ion channel.